MVGRAVAQQAIKLFFNIKTMQRMNKFFVLTMLVALSAMFMQINIFRTLTAMAYSAGDVVINEVAWAGTADGANDEWIELYNTTNSAVDLTGWKIDDDNGSSIYNIASGTIQPHGYFLIEDTEVTTNVAANAIINVSLANAGDSLVLKDSAGLVVDTVNGTGGAWYAGNGTTKATMERIDPNVLTDSAANWLDAKSSNGALGRTNSAILGTPGSVNSNYGGSGPEVSITPAENTKLEGDRITLAVEVDGATDLYAYGFEIDYDPTVLAYVSAAEGNLLKLNGATTAFNVALQNGEQGALIVGNARLVNPPTGVDGSGKLIDIVFDVIGNNGSDCDISFASSSYLSDSSEDIPAQFTSSTITVGAQTTANPVTNLKVLPSTARYSLDLSWSAGTGGADTFIIKRKAVDGSFSLLGTTANTLFADNNSLVPGVTYTYQITAVKAGAQSTAVQITGVENRGVVGDLDRSDRVDGKDIEKLARSYGSGVGDEEYDALNDTNFDGIIDGNDLINLGANFGVTYGN